MSKDYLMVIGNEDVASGSGRWMDVTSPATGELVGRAPRANAEDVNQAATAAARGFEEWSGMTAFDRAKLMKAAAERIRSELKRLAILGVEEEGKPLNQSEGDTNAVANMLDMYAEEGLRIRGEVVPSMHPEREVFILREPVGVVACIVPWNYPLALMGRSMTAPLGAGCSVIVKPASATPLASIEMVKIFRDVGFPPGVVNIVTGPGDETGDALVGHPLVAKICFTGGIDAGKRVLKLAAEGIKGVALELGGQCPAIVARDAKIDIAVDAIIGQAYKNSGEVCNRVNRIYVDKDVESEFRDQFGKKVSKITVGPGMANPDSGPLIDEENLARVESHVRDAVSKGGKIIAGGQRLRGGNYNRGAFFPATAIANCTPEMLVMTDETMGPVVGIMAVDSVEEGIQAGNRTSYGLSAFLFTSDIHTALKGMHEMKAGTVYVNDIHGHYIHCPYGGMKQSGIGRSWGRPGIEEFLEYKTAYLDWAKQNRGGYPCVHND